MNTSIVVDSDYKKEYDMYFKNVFKLYIYKNFKIKLEQPYILTEEKVKELTKEANIDKIIEALIKNLYNYVEKGGINYLNFFDSMSNFINSPLAPLYKISYIYSCRFPITGETKNDDTLLALTKEKFF